MGAKSTGKLYAELFPHKEMSRDDFENLLGGMARAGIVRLDDAVFEKDGRQIPYRTARLTSMGSKLDARTPVNLVMKELESPASTSRRQKKKTGKLRFSDKKPPAGSAAMATTGGKSKRPLDTESDGVVEEALRAWRMAEARRLRVPAFLILTDRALKGLIELRPKTSSEMLSVPGIGLRIAEKYGTEICRILTKG